MSWGGERGEVARDWTTQKFHLNAWLMPALGPGPRGSSWIVEGVRERLAWTSPQYKLLYTHEDLVRMKIEWIYDVVDMSWSKSPPPGAHDSTARAPSSW